MKSFYKLNFISFYPIIFDKVKKEKHQNVKSMKKIKNKIRSF